MNGSIILFLCTISHCMEVDDVIYVPNPLIPYEVPQESYVPPDNFPKFIHGKKIVYVKPGARI